MDRFNCNNCFSGGDAVTEPQPCQRGHYCPAMTTSPDQWPCPPGTFTNRSDLSDASECTNCTAGYYCTGKDGYLFTLMNKPETEVIGITYSGIIVNFPFSKHLFCMPIGVSLVLFLMDTLNMCFYE